MIEEGLVAEVKALKARGYDRSMVSMQGLGYKEILDYLDGVCTLEDAIYKIKRDTRHCKTSDYMVQAREACDMD